VRVIWVGDAVISSGFARCTHAVCDALHAAGHEVFVLGINYYGDPHKYPYAIYPCVQPLDFGGDPYGVLRLPILCRRLNPDVICILQDPWNINDPNNQPSYLDMLKRTDVTCPIVAWLAVDGLNQFATPLNDLTHVAVWTQFAADELVKGGYTGPISIVPLGVDTTLFHPCDRAESRSKVCPPTLPADAYLVGAVGRNQPRKRLDLTIAYFADWVTRYNIDNAYLYLHIGPTGDIGCDIPKLVRYYGLAGDPDKGKPSRVIIANTPLGMGHDESIMPYVYSSFDCYLSTSQGEGWNLPMLEAMACGVPVIAPDFAGPGSWAKGVAVLVPCTSTALTAPINAMNYTIGGILDQRLTVDALDTLYRSVARRVACSELGLGMAKSLSWRSTGDGMRAVLESVVANRAKADTAVSDETEEVAAAHG
jgi:D-inositol-3-phosphate glycosyltransferase